MSSYPVLQYHTLSRVPARRILPRRRELNELPSPVGNSVLVAMVGGRGELLAEQNLTPTTDAFVNASSIAVVDIGPGRRVTARLQIESAAAGHPFSVDAIFSCQVTDPVAVVEAVPDDLVRELAGHLRQDQTLTKLGARFEPRDSPDFARHAGARIRAICQLRPPTQPGMKITLDTVEVETTEEAKRRADEERRIAHERAEAERKHREDREEAARQHEREQEELGRRHELALRAEELRQTLERLKRTFGFEQAQLIEEILRRGPEAIEALFLELQDDNYLHAAERAYSERDAVEARLREFIGTLSDRGHFDRVAVDSQRLINEYFDGMLKSRSRHLRDGSAGPSIVLGDGDSKRVAQADLPEGEVDEESSTRPADLPDEDAG